MKKKSKPANSSYERADSSYKKNPPLQKSLIFPIVGIGKYAGGLEELVQFLQQVPKKFCV